MSRKPPRILVISEIPTPYRLPLYERLADRPEIELELVFCARGEPDRPWELAEGLDSVRHRVLRGVAPTFRTRRNTFVYQLNPGAVPLVARTRCEAIVVGGYSVFAEQAAMAIARLRNIPYMIHSESTLLSPRPPILRLAKSALVRPVVSGASAGLATGADAARYLTHYGLPVERIRIVPNAIDVVGYGRTATEVRRRSSEVRAARNLPDRFVLFAGRLVEDKGILDLVEAIRLLGLAAPSVLFAGEGPLAQELGSLPKVHRLGFVQPERLVELFSLADWTVVPSHREPWGVVVNESLACGCPVIVTDVVGAAADLVEEGVNGRIIPARSPAAIAAALSGPRPTGDPSRGRIERWTHDFAVDQFLEAVEVVLPGRLPAR